MKYFTNPKERLLKNLKNVNGCLEWQKGCDRDGYGLISVNGNQWRAHRFAYRTLVGEIPDDKMVRHTCDNRKCCRPSHLVLGDHQSNMADMVSRERQSKGEKHYKAKLSQKAASVIRGMYKRHPGYSGVNSFLARWFDVEPAIISNVKTGKMWA